MMNKKKISRRDFIRQSSCSLVGASALASAFLNLGMKNPAAGSETEDGNDYKALVCILFAGGIDSFNVLVPRGNVEYEEYKQIRSDLALEQNTLLPIIPQTTDGKEYGIHPSMSEVQGMFNEGNIAFLANVGTLVEPTTREQFENNSVKLPLGMFSHSDQITHWQTSIPNQRSVTGWGGRIADIISGINLSQNISMNISLSGSNIFQVGKESLEYAIQASGNGAIEIIGFGNNDDPYYETKTTAINRILDLEYNNILEKTIATKTKESIEKNKIFSSAIKNIDDFSTQFSGSRFSQSLQMVAKTIAARNTLGMRRQTFFIEFGGWDHHDEVLNNQLQMLPVVSKGVSEFYSALKEIGVENNVTTFTTSDFARTLTSNGEGSDHAWGGNHIIIGGAVKGGDIYGKYPSLFAGNSLDIGRGRLIPTTSIDAYFAELACWFGVNIVDLPIIFPNIENFYDINSGINPIGFM